MNVSRILNVLLLIVVVVLVVKIVFFPSRSCETGKEDAEAVVMENILTRTSIRDYQDKPVEEEKVEKLLRAAMAAPTAGNKQPWVFVVVKDKATLQAISGEYRPMRMAEKAPMAIVVCGDMELTFPEEGRDYWVEDTSAATENLLLAAHAMGLGAVWCGIYPLPERVAFFSTLLQLPENLVPMCVVPVGYPAENPAPKDKWKPEKIYNETWKPDFE